MQAPRLGAGWLDSLQARAQRPPLVARAPLTWRGRTLGSIEARVAAGLREAGLAAREAGWEVQGDRLDAALHCLACALRDKGLLRAWRDEQLPVRDAAGMQLATVERGAVRLLGIATEAVHLLGVAPDGRHWVQQRAFDKADDPGLWDTLVGGMIPAAETMESALARETMEEAGLALDCLGDVRFGGFVATQRPSASTPGGYIVERLAWFTCLVPEGRVPVNQDGEVAQFRCMDSWELAAVLEADEFTLDAGLMYAALG